jgi:hypothetical protein
MLCTFVAQNKHKCAIACSYQIARVACWAECVYAWFGVLNFSTYVTNVFRLHCLYKCVKITCCGGEVMPDVTCAPVFDRVIWFVGVVYACLKMDVSFRCHKNVTFL